MNHTSIRPSALFTLDLEGLVLVVALGLALATPGNGHAQITQHFGSQTTVVTGSASQAFTAMAIDTSGNLYIADQTNSLIYKETLSGGTYTQSTIVPSGYGTSGGVKLPTGIAVDSSGNVYISDSLNERVLKETPAGGGTYTQTVVMQNSGGNFVNPYGLAVDSSGDVFVSAQAYNLSTSTYQYHVFEFTPGGGGTYTETVLTVTGLETPTGLAIDSSNNLYIADQGYPRVLKGTVSAGVYTQSVVVDDSSFNWLDNPGYIAVDNSGNVYAVNGGPGGYDAETVIEALPIGGSYQFRLAGGGFSNTMKPTSAVTDSSGNLFVSVALTSGTYEVLEISTPATSLGSVNVGSTSAVFTMPFTFSTATTYPQTGAAYSQGATGEFVDTGTGTCDTGGSSKYYAAGTSCTVNVTFSPKFAGTRQGAVEVVNLAGVIIAEQFITGTGLGPQATFSPGTVTTFGTLSSPTGVAVDGKGVVYVADGGSNNLIYTETPSGNTYTQAQLGTSQSGTGVYGVTIDGGDNVTYGYTVGTQYLVGQVQPLLPSSYNGVIVADNGEGSALNTAKGLASDSGGNIYIADAGNNRVVEVLYSSGSNYDQPMSWQINVATGLSNPSAVAVDGSGNVYIADTGNNRVLKETPSGAGFFTQSIVVNTGLTAPAGAAVDDIGNIYISDTGNSRVLKETVSGSSTYTQSVVLSTGLASPQGLTLDASGNLYIADSARKVVVKLAQGTAPSLTFASTAVGSTSSDSPQTVTLNNLGTTALTFPIPGTGNNPSISTNFSLSSTGGTACPLISSTAGAAGSLAANSSCTLPISFAPATTGTLNGSLMLTDNTLNAASSTQSISLNGTGTSTSAPIAGLTPTPFGFSDQTAGTTSGPQIFILSNTGTAALTITNIAITGLNPGDFYISNNFCSSSLAQNTSCNISVTFMPASAASYSAQLSVTDNASSSPQIALLSGTGTPAVPIATLSPGVGFGNQPEGTTSSPAQPFTLSNTGTATLNIASITIGGTNPGNFAMTSASNCGSTLAQNSSCTIDVTFSPSAPTGYTALLTVTDNATGSPQTAVLSGTGIYAQPTVTLLPSPVSFGSVTLGSKSAAQTVTLTNTGTSPFTITNFGIADTTDFSETTTCAATLSPKSNCTFSVTFAPASVGTINSTLSVIDSSDSVTASATLNGTGAALPAPIASLAPNPVPFPNTTVNTAATALSATLSNTGNAPLTISAISIGGTNPGDFSYSTAVSNGCGATLAASSNCTISVGFTPASAAPFTATLSVTTNAAGSPQTTTLTGTGTAPTDFSVAAANPSQSVQPGGTAQFSISVASLSGNYNIPVVLSVSGLPSGATASFAPASVVPGSSGASAVLSVQTASLTAAAGASGAIGNSIATASSHDGSGGQRPWLATLLLLPLLGLAQLRRRLCRLPKGAKLLLLGVLALSSLLPLSGCGGGYFGPAPQTVILTITGTSGALQHSTTVNLTIQ